MLKTDVLIVGSGIAGLFCALKTAQKRPDLSIVIMTKETAENTNTRLAQGGIAVVTNLISDSYDQHIKDTLVSGGGYCDEEIVKMVIEQAPARLNELVQIGTNFDKNPQANWDLGLEGGHSQHRIVHYKDASGLEIHQKLLNSIKRLPNIQLLEHQLVIELHTERTDQKSSCTGAFFYNQNTDQIKYIRSRTIVLATGGCGQLFENTTNPSIATGDGIAMALSIGVEIADMKYIQFHPTALFAGKKNPFFLISEAVRGFGAHIVNEQQKRFLFKYHAKGELATRDIVSQSIYNEMEQTQQKEVYLDCRHLDPEIFYKRFPTITSYCNQLGIRPENDLIPIVPAAHYQCGGIKVDQNGATTIKNLYAIGECARTGLHGKNRLASNSLLEAIVFAHQASENIDKTISEYAFSSKILVPKYPNAGAKNDPETFIRLKKELQTLMTHFYANRGSNNTAIIEKIELMKKTTLSLLEVHKITAPLVEFFNMLTVSLIIIKHSNTPTYIKTATQV